MQWHSFSLHLEINGIKVDINTKKKIEYTEKNH